MPNDFPGFFRRHPLIRTVFFNGAKAEQAWKRSVAPSLPDLGLQLVRLPSTSPAHAGLSLQQKIDVWRAVTEAARQGT